MFRLARPGDFPIGLACERAAYDYWGQVIWPQGKRAQTFSEQRSAIATKLWIWDADGEPDSIPSDHLQLEQLHPLDQFDELYDRLRHIKNEPLLPDNFPDLIWNSARTIQRLCEVHSQPCLAYILMHSQPSNSLLNALHAAFICELTALHLKMDELTRLAIVSAALTMNWTILDLQDVLSYQGQRPTASERLAIMQHPTSIETLLISCGVENSIWLGCCKQHHEEPNGKGYPNKLIEKELIAESAVLRCADRYVALAVSRLHRFGMSTPEALTQLYEQQKSFDKPIIDALAKVVSPIAPGSKLILSDGSYARSLGLENPSFLRTINSDGILRIELLARCTAVSPSEDSIPSLFDFERLRALIKT